MDNANSPYFLLGGDHPSLIVVSHPLREIDYNSRSRSMYVPLSVENKDGFVDGLISKPLDTYPNVGARLRCNNMVIAWIINSIFRDIAGRLLYLDTAKVVWRDL